MSSALRSTFGHNEIGGQQKPYVGDTKTSIVMYDHYGWLICDGRSLSVSEYPLLFDVVRYSFGGSGSSFNLPNPMGRVVGYIGSGSGLTTRTKGDITGEETETLDISEMPAHNHGGLTSISGDHTHTITDPGHTHTTALGDLDDTNLSSQQNQVPPADAGATSTTYTIASNTTGITINNSGDHQHIIATEGGGQPFSNMQPTLFLGNMFIYSGKRYTGTVANKLGRSIYG